LALDIRNWRREIAGILLRGAKSLCDPDVVATSGNIAPESKTAAAAFLIAADRSSAMFPEPNK
jgi:hypothetical protein